MQRVFNNISKSRAPLMVVLRNVLVVAIIVMGIARLRITLILLFTPGNYQHRDILQMYLMSKALLTGVNPYLPLNELVVKLLGNFTYFPHPSPYPPFTAILFIPFAWFDFKIAVIIWYIIEILCLAGIAGLLTFLLTERIKVIPSVLIFFGLLAWYPFMYDLEVGQVIILLTLLLIGCLVALKRNKPVIAGILLGLSMTIKLFTWPLILYWIIKKEWKAALSSISTGLGLNLIALLVMGSDNFFNYYLHISQQIFEIYHRFWANFSAITIGYRLFEGTDSAIFESNYHAPPLINFPSIAPFVSFGLIALLLGVCIIWSARSTDIETAFAININLMLLISPIVWDHYSIIVIISLIVMYKKLVRQSFPTYQTFIFMLIILFQFLINEHVYEAIFLLNGGVESIQARGGQLSFSSSLLVLIPIVELITLSFILWYSGVKQDRLVHTTADLRAKNTLITTPQ